MTININLLPWREELKEQKKKEFFILVGISSFISLMLIVAVHFSFVQEIKFQNSLNQILQNQISVLDKKIAEIDGLQKEKERLLARMEIIQQLQGNRPMIVRLFDNITRTIPDGLYLKSINRTDYKLLIEGKAESNTRVSKFMRNIDSSEWLGNPVLSYIQAEEESDKNNMIGFNLQAIQKREHSE